MKFERFIARRFMPRSKDGGGFSGPLSVIAVTSIALGVLVMVMSVSILRGFQGDIAGKVAGFGSHLTVSNYVANPAFQETPIVIDSALIDRLLAVSGVRHLQCFASKGGMVKTQDQIYGIILRGLSANYDTSFFASNLVDGRLPDFSGDSGSSSSNEVLISSTIASRLKLKVGDKMRCYFWGGNTAGSNAAADGIYRSRAFTVSGIYNTDLTEMDELYVIGSLSQVQKLNDWGVGDSNGANDVQAPLVGGYELLVDDFDRLDATAFHVLEQLPYDLNLQTIKEAHPALFSWLDLLNSNITLILTIMSLVCAIAIVSALLIMIFEKSRTIGLLKALGATNASVRRIFLLKALRLILEGIAIGNAVALALCLVQQRFQVVKLDPESYSMGHVPVDLDVTIFILISIATLAVCLVAMLLPAAYISRIHPAVTLKTDN